MNASEPINLGNGVISPNLDLVVIEILLDCRDALNLLTEQSKKQRVEKAEVCKECGGTRFVYEIDLTPDHKTHPRKVPCPDCTPNPQN